MASEAIPKRRIAYLLGGLNPSETFIRREIELLREMGFSIELFTLDDSPGATPVPSGWRLNMLGQAAASAMTGELTRLGLDVSELSRGERARLQMHRVRARWLAERLIESGIEHLHAHFMSAPASVGTIATRLSDITLSLSGHARDIYVGATLLADKVSTARFVTVCNESARDALLSRIPEQLHDRVRLLHHGVPAPVPPVGPTPERGPIFAAGRLVEKKGFSGLLRAVRELRSRGEHVECRIAGTGPLLRHLRFEAKDLGIAHQVRWLGWLEPMRVFDELRKASVCVVPSVVDRENDRDGIPNIVLEAFAHGVPVVAGAVGGIPEAVENRVTGLLVSPDRHEQIAEAIQRIRREPTLRRELVVAAVRKVREEFNLQENVRKLADLFESVVREDPVKTSEGTNG